MSEAIRVVIIGDNADSTGKIAKWVSKQGNDALVEGIALDFEDGTKLIHKSKPMVVILDMCAHGINPCVRWIETILHIFPHIAIFAFCDDSSYESVRNFMRAGATEYLLKPVSEVDLSSALKKFGALRALPESKETKEGKVYSISSSKNGVGNTTIAVNLAGHIYKLTKEPTVIVDLDLIGGDVTTFLNMKPDGTIGDVSRNITRLNMGHLQGIIAKHDSGIYVLAAPHNMEEGVVISGDTVRKVLTLLKTRYKHIIIDTEANLTQTTMAAIDMSDLIFVTFVLSLPSIKNTRRYMNYLDKHTLRSQQIRLVVNRYFKKCDTTVAEAEKILQRPVFWCIPNDFKTAMSCIHKGAILEDHAPQSRLNLSLKDLAMTVMGKAEQLKTKTSPFKRLFKSP